MLSEAEWRPPKAVLDDQGQLALKLGSARSKANSSYYNTAGASAIVKPELMHGSKGLNARHFHSLYIR